MPASLSSMTGYASSDGISDGLGWGWELRSVNGRGLDVRFRLPSGWDGHEAALRQSLSARLKRGSVNAVLTLKRDATAPLSVQSAVLERVLALAIELAARIPGAPPPRAESLLALPGVLRASETEPEISAQQRAAVLAGFEAALAELVAARQGEGARLRAVLAAQLRQIADLTAQAAAAAEAQPEKLRQRLIDALQAVLETGIALDPARLAQEVALLVSRADVREELDRLASHLAAAEALLAEAEAVGRRLDFLVQEFNREANTLCSKSASPGLTAIGLQLKATIEQFREQVQNIE